MGIAHLFLAHFKLLRWARENGCEWNSRTSLQTVCHNNLDILKWLYEKGCPFDDNMGESCIRCYNIEMLEWITDQGYEWTLSP